MSLPNKTVALAAKLVSDAVKGHDSPACRAMFDHACEIERERDALLAIPVTDGVWEALEEMQSVGTLGIFPNQVMHERYWRAHEKIRAALATRGAGPREPITVEAIRVALKSGAIKAHALQAELKSVFGMPSVELTMQDIRLHVGEGKLTPQAVLNGANAALRAAPPLPESPWKAIETAPKKGLVDIWIERSNELNGVRWADCYYDRICDEWRTSRPSGRLISVPARSVKYWMHGPAAPESPKGGEDADRN